VMLRLCVQGIEEWCTGLPGPRTPAGEGSMAREIGRLRWGALGLRAWEVSLDFGEAGRVAGLGGDGPERLVHGGRV
jgi:hypothetical protein